MPERKNCSDQLVKQNCYLAKKLWLLQAGSEQLRFLRDLTRRHRFSVSAGHVLLLEGQWYITHVGLLDYARRHHCLGIQVEPVSEFCDATNQSWSFKATAFVSLSCKGFVGFGDAAPSNVSSLVRGAEMRVAETRAVNRALRKAYGIGICSVEELGSNGAGEPEGRRRPPQPSNGNGWSSGPRVRDRLCQLIRQHQLDPDLVKAYAVDFCGTKTLKDATRAQVEAFVEHLADWAEKDRNALLCQLNSYFRVKEAQDNQEPKREGAA
jgi:hypothetical protein